MLVSPLRIKVKSSLELGNCCEKNKEKSSKERSNFFRKRNSDFFNSLMAFNFKITYLFITLRT